MWKNLANGSLQFGNLPAMRCIRRKILKTYGKLSSLLGELTAKTANDCAAHCRSAFLLFWSIPRIRKVLNCILVDRIGLITRQMGDGYSGRIPNSSISAGKKSIAPHRLFRITYYLSPLAAFPPFTGSACCRVVKQVRNVE